MSHSQRESSVSKNTGKAATQSSEIAREKPSRARQPPQRFGEQYYHEVNEKIEKCVSKILAAKSELESNGPDHADELDTIIHGNPLEKRSGINIVCLEKGDIPRRSLSYKSQDK